MARLEEEAEIEKRWASDERWRGIERPYKAADVVRLGGSLRIEHTLARLGAERFWKLLHTEPFIPALGALTGNQALQQVRAGLKAIYVSGWQVAADANLAGEMYPDQSLYPADSVPSLVRSINQTLQRADQIDHSEGRNDPHWFAPIVADGEAGFGGPLNTFELVKAMIEAGAAAVHLEDQLSSLKKCGHMGGKVLVPVQEFIPKLISARFAADVQGVPTLLIARTDALNANLIRSNTDPRDQPFIAGDISSEGFYDYQGGIEAVLARSLAYAPYADMLWFETAEPNLAEAKQFAEGIRAKFPGKLLAYNCSPSFNWKKMLDDASLSRFQRELGAIGYRFQFVTLAGFHTLNYGMFSLAQAYKERGMLAYAEQVQQLEFACEKQGYTAVRHQHEVGAGYFDEVTLVVSGGSSATTALKGSTEEKQF